MRQVMLRITLDSYPQSKEVKALSVYTACGNAINLVGISSEDTLEDMVS